MEEPKRLTEAEIKQIKKTLLLSDKERFLMTTRLYKIQQTLKRAIITHQPFSPKP